MTRVAGALLRSEEPGRYASAVFAVLVHGLLALFLVYGVRWQNPVQEAVEVELVRSAPEPAPEPPPQPAPDPAPEPAPEARPAPVKPDIALKEKEKPKPTPKPENKTSNLNPIEWLRREAAHLAQQKAVNAEMQQLNKLKAAQEAAAHDKARADYLARIRGKIRGNIVLPPEIEGNPEAEFEVIQLPSGEVMRVRLARSSGNPALDSAIERAILKSNPLPQAPNGLFERTLAIRYRPRED